jgi:Na+/phosphate symporter
MPLYVLLVILLVGVLLYLRCANPKHQEVGRIMFAFGLLVFLLAISSGRVLTLPHF